MLAAEPRTIADLVAEAPLRANVFEKRRIDYCCNGRRTLEQVCREHGLDIEEIRAELRSAQQPAGIRDWRRTSLTELCDHVIQVHHVYLTCTLPSARMKAVKVVQAHGAKHAFLAPLAQALDGLAAELTEHMTKEETVLFPYIARLERASRQGIPPPPAPGGTVRMPIAIMEREHDDAGRALERMRDLTSGYHSPADACNTFRALYAQLQEIERDLHAHIHLENNILFPRAAELESRLNEA